MSDKRGDDLENINSAWFMTVVKKNCGCILNVKVLLINCFRHTTARSVAEQTVLAQAIWPTLRK